MQEKTSHLNLKTRTFDLGIDPEGLPRFLEVSEDDILAIFKGNRPRNMSYGDFKQIQRTLKKELAQYLKGEIVHLSKVSDTVWDQYTKGKKIKQRGHTYIKEKNDENNR